MSIEISDIYNNYYIGIYVRVVHVSCTRFSRIATPETPLKIILKFYDIREFYVCAFSMLVRACAQ